MIHQILHMSNRTALRETLPRAMLINIGVNSSIKDSAGDDGVQGQDVVDRWGLGCLGRMEWTAVLVWRWG